MEKTPFEIYIMADPQTDLEQNLHLYSSQSKGKSKQIKKYYVQDQGKDL